MTDRTATRLEGGRRLQQSATRKPLVSVVTVIYNSRRELPKLFDSIAAVKTDDIEYIVIDGGSKDGTIDDLRQREDLIDYWLSEPDGGIYDAMNKGVSAATGEYILHINAGDRVLQIPKPELEQALADNVDVVSFAVQTSAWGIHHPFTGFLLRFVNTWHHQGTFYRRAGHFGYDMAYRIFADFDMNQRLLKAHKKVRLHETIVAEQFDVGVSANMSNYNEQYRIVRRNFGLPYVALSVLWRYFWSGMATLRRWKQRFA